MFATVSHFYPRQAFAGNVGAYLNGAPFMTQLRWVAPRLALKYWTREEVTDIGKHSSLLRYGKNYCRKKFYSTDPRRGLPASGCQAEARFFFKYTLKPLPGP